jgi:hypothetical protein
VQCREENLEQTVRYLCCSFKLLCMCEDKVILVISKILPVAFSSTRPDPNHPIFPLRNHRKFQAKLTKAKYLQKAKTVPEGIENKNPPLQALTYPLFFPFSFTFFGKMLNSVVSGSNLLLQILRFHFPFYAYVNVHIYATFSGQYCFFFFFFRFHLFGCS